MIQPLKKCTVAGLVIALLIGSCKSVDQTTPCTASPVTTQAPQAEIASLKQYIDSNKINATADARGFYYTIQAPGTEPNQPYAPA